MVPLARRYLLTDKPRLGISAGGVAFAVLLIVLIVALYRGIYDQAGRLATQAPSELWVRQAGSVDPAHGASVLQAPVLDRLHQVPGVAAAQPLLARSMQVGPSPNEGGSVLVMALPEGPLQDPAAQAFGVPALPARGEIVLSDPVSGDVGAGTGDAVFIGTTPFEVTGVSGLIDSAFTATVVVNAADAADLFVSPGAFSFALVAVEAGADMEQVKAEIEARLPGVTAATRDEFADLNRREVQEGFLPVVAVLAGVAFVVGLAVIALTIYTSTVERIRDYGVLKAVGASSRQLFWMVGRQSLAVALLGYVLGAALALGAGRLLSEAVAEFATLYRWQDLLAVLGAALVMSALAAVVPVRRVAHVDPAAVFRA